MFVSELAALYDQRQTSFAHQLRDIRKSINVVSNIRLALALLFILLIYLGIKADSSFFYTLPLLAGLFFYLVRKHSALFHKKTHFENLVRINKDEFEMQNGNVGARDGGGEYVDGSHPYTHDLDIFGEGSLYQWVNRANTLIGRNRFASRLATPLASRESIVANQDAIRELAPRIDFRQDFQAAGLEIEESKVDRDKLLNWLRHPNFLYGKRLYRILLSLVPAITLTLLLLTFFDIRFRPFVILLAILQWAFLGVHLKKVNTFHDYVSRKKNILQRYASLLFYLQHQTFHSELLNNLRKKADAADTKVKALAALVYALDARLNAMTSLFANSFLLYDLNCVYRLEKWKEENASNLSAWLDAISDLEVVNSFSTFAFNHNRFTYPKIEERLAIEADDLGHPLISAEECVVNDLKIGDGPTVLIVTGANMAGKSTFLRTIGINLILALNGSPVCASRFCCPVISLRTGMRTADSLKDHQSYFYAELDRLKGIMDDLRSDKPLLILLDEILKGTNSTDKQSGSIALVKQLLPHPCLALIATHDLALGDLETEFPNKVKNYCFEANIENDQLSFDYKLKQGLATKMNATFLMKKMGIIPT